MQYLKDRPAFGWAAAGVKGGELEWSQIWPLIEAKFISVVQKFVGFTILLVVLVVFASLVKG